MTPKQEFTTNFFKHIEKPVKILITSHRSPDDDSIASVLLMYSLLYDRYPEKHIVVAYSGEVNRRWRSFLYADTIVAEADMSAQVANADVVIILDGNRYKRIGSTSEAVGRSGAHTICIDHHEGEPDAFDLEYIDPLATSCTEILYRLFFSQQSTLSREISELLLMGILSDTGLLSRVRADHLYVLGIVEKIAQDANIGLEELELRFLRFSQRTFRAFQECSANARIIDPPNMPAALVSQLTEAWRDEGNYTLTELKDGLELFINTQHKIYESISWGYVVYPGHDGKPGVSLRSASREVNVYTLLAQLGLTGGGHPFASGATFPESISHVSDAYDYLSEKINSL